MPAFIRRAAPLAAAVALLTAATAALHVEAGSTAKPAAAPAANAKSIERGRYLARIAGCNDCHTPGYAQTGGKVGEKLWLTGDSLGWQGAWGTTYPSNLRLALAKMTEQEWVRVAKSAQYRPPTCRRPTCAPSTVMCATSAPPASPRPRTSRPGRPRRAR